MENGNEIDKIVHYLVTHGTTNYIRMREFRKLIQISYSSLPHLFLLSTFDVNSLTLLFNCRSFSCMRASSLWNCSNVAFKRLCAFCVSLRSHSLLCNLQKILTALYIQIQFNMFGNKHQSELYFIPGVLFYVQEFCRDNSLSNGTVASKNETHLVWRSSLRLILP